MFGAEEIPWTFKTWIANFQGVDLPIGDLANDINGDDDFPDDDDFSDIYDHLMVKHCSREALETFVIVWNFYLISK